MTTVREERRLVTCMFVDVVGSTELLTRLGAERLKRELGAAFGELSGIITAHGGTVEKYVGDAIYALFGAPVAHEDDPLRALRAAQALREWSASGATQRVPFAVRVGIETGEAVIDLAATEGTRQQMSVGPVVNLAARLQQRAEPGEVLVGATTHEATDGSAELEGLGDVELKGIGSVPVWRLTRVGVPQVRTLPFVGRDAEIGLLDHAYQRASKGRSVLAVVSGPPGQGKTRLVQEFLRQRADACRVITARCRPPEEVGMFAPVRDILGVTTLDALADMVGRLCTDDVECQRVVAGLAESAGIATTRSLSALPAAERDDEIVQAWRRYIAILGEDRLVILAIDDVHWADASLVRLIDRLTFGGPRVLLLATARPEFAQAAGIRPTGDRFFIELEGLEPDEAKRLALLAGRDDERVVARAEGNPLFLVELARATHDGAELPITLQGALGARLDELPPADRGLLSLAAVAGERFTAADAAFLAGCDLVSAGRSLAHMVDLHFLDLSEAGYRFHHGLVRDVAYGRLLTVERMKAHARFARERVHPEDAEALAYHWWEALRPPDGEWVWADDPSLPGMRREAYHALLAAGRRHADHFAPEPAELLLSRARALSSSDRERAEVERILGTAYGRILRQDDAWTHLMNARDLYRRSGDVPIALYIDLMEAAAWFGAFKHKPSDDEIDAVAEDGIAAARAAGDLRSVARIFGAHAGFFNQSLKRERGAQLIEAAIEAAEASGDAETRRSVLFTRAVRLGQLGRPVSRAELAELEPRTEDALDRIGYLRVRANNEIRHGDLEAARGTALEAVDLSAPMGPHNRTHAWSPLAAVLLLRGEWAELIDLGQRTAKLVTENTASAFCGAAATTLRDAATAQALAGRREEAAGLLRALPLGGNFEVDLVAMVPRALLGLRSPESDAKLREKGPWGWWEWGQAALRAVILGRPDDAEEALRQMGQIVDNSPTYRAFAEGVRESVAELRGGPKASHEALRKMGFDGWIQILERRVDAEY